jgi:hypothetical protein
MTPSPPLEPSAYKPDDMLKANALFGHEMICEALSEVLFSEPAKRPQGLLVIAGSTDSGKNNIARGLIHCYLSELDRTKKPQHLLSYEDPIELPFFDKADDPLSFDTDIGHNLGVIHTPRELGQDVRDLRAAIRDALRQTPSVVYIGEVRDRSDWPLILDFAGTGHFVVTTAHAGSLPELLSNLLHAVDAGTPAQRGYYARRLFALIHLARFPKLSDTLVANRLKSFTTLEGVLPTLWRQSGDAIPRLVNDYLASLLPTDTGGVGNPGPEHFVLGRSYFARRLAERCVEDPKTAKDFVLGLLLPYAKASDLKGE